MSELERALVGLGAQLDLPEAPDVSAAVLRRISEAPARRRFPARRALVLALVVLAVAIGAVMAVPPARTAVLEFFGLKGATVRRVDTLPKVPTSPSAATLDLGSPVPLTRSGKPNVKIAGVVLPGALGRPDAAYVKEEAYGLKLTLVYEPGPGAPPSPYTGVGLLVTEFQGKVEPEFVEKLVDSGTRVEELTVAGAPALWLEGGPHFVLFRDARGGFAEDRGRFAGNTLLVQRDDVLVRIEGEIDRDRAVEIAESLGPP
jgi:hypothetical protein